MRFPLPRPPTFERRETLEAEMTAITSPARRATADEGSNVVRVCCVPAAARARVGAGLTGRRPVQYTAGSAEPPLLGQAIRKRAHRRVPARPPTIPCHGCPRPRSTLPHTDVSSGPMTFRRSSRSCSRPAVLVGWHTRVSSSAGLPARLRPRHRIAAIDFLRRGRSPTGPWREARLRHVSSAPCFLDHFVGPPPTT